MLQRDRHLRRPLTGITEMCTIVNVTIREHKTNAVLWNKLALPSFESPRTSPSSSSQLGGMCLHVFVCSSTTCGFLRGKIVDKEQYDQWKEQNQGVEDASMQMIDVDVEIHASSFHI